MDIHELFQMQDSVATQNSEAFRDQFRWCRRALELALEVDVSVATSPEANAFREQLQNSEGNGLEAWTTTFSLIYDATGTLISAFRLVQHGVLADAWCLIRGAFESTCYAEYFAHKPDKVSDYLKIAAALRSDNSANVGRLLRTHGLAPSGPQGIMAFLDELLGENRSKFYARLSVFGTHPSPVRAGFRLPPERGEVRAYLSIEHKWLPQCLADLAAVAKYNLSLPFETWPHLVEKQALLCVRQKALSEEFFLIFYSKDRSKKE